MYLCFCFICYFCLLYCCHFGEIKMNIIPKPGKDISDPTNYRPIALTSCVCKAMERMVNDRLVWYLERNKIITPTQSGFRKGRSTTDQLVRLKSLLSERLLSRSNVLLLYSLILKRRTIQLGSSAS